jgi:CheY-like chemotaxis protein
VRGPRQTQPLSGFSIGVTGRNQSIDYRSRGEPRAGRLRKGVVSGFAGDQGDNAGFRVLIVEDHDDSAELLGIVVRGAGCTLSRAASFAEATALLDQSFDLIITDLELPDGDGLELVGRFRERRPVRVIVLSGHGDDATLQRSKAADVDMHLTKPVEVKTLRETLARFVASR